MRRFLNHFLTYPQSHTLIPYQFRQMWGRIQPRRPDNGGELRQLYTVRWQIDPSYQAPIEELLAGRFPPRYRYRHFTIPKKDGSKRAIMEPLPPLKAMQHAILENYLMHDRPHRAAVGYRKGMSVADHAWAHAGARTIITADIQDFFPSTTRYRIRSYWRDHPRYRLNEPAVQLLTNLTTYRGSLPQGAPTSPALSNLVNKELDTRLHAIIGQSGGVYTRYADDLVFSWQGRSRPPTDFEQLIRRILREYGYTVHPKKGWNVWSREDEPEITGTVLLKNGSVDIPPTLRDHMKQLAQSRDPYDQFRLAGYEGYRQMIRR